jgi:hypothetical protein
MPTIKCPTCGRKGGTEVGSHTFEVRGQLQGKPVRRCRNCGAGMTVGLGLTGAKAQPIDPDLWRTMEASWAHEFEAEADESEAPKRQTHYHVWEYASGGSPRRTLAIFGEQSSAERYADEHVLAFEAPYVARGDARSGYSITSTVSDHSADLGTIRVEACELDSCTPDV